MNFDPCTEWKRLIAKTLDAVDYLCEMTLYHIWATFHDILSAAPLHREMLPKLPFMGFAVFTMSLSADRHQHVYRVCR